VKKKDMQAQLDDLAERHSQLAAVVSRLAAHAEVVAIAVRSPDSVPSDDLDDAIDGLHELHSALHNSPLRA
jgi:hypothetical protein